MHYRKEREKDYRHINAGKEKALKEIDFPTLDKDLFFVAVYHFDESIIAESLMIENGEMYRHKDTGWYADIGYEDYRSCYESLKAKYYEL